MRPCTPIRRLRPALAAALLCLPLTVAGADGNVYLDVSAGYRTGDFGTPVTSELYDVTPEVGYVTADYNVGVALPLLVLHSEGGGVSASASGVGDMLIRGGLKLWQSAGGGTALNGGAAVKLATGDEDKGLGTGATNYGGFVSVNRRLFGSVVTVMSGYIVTGSPQGADYDDVVPYGISLQRAVASTNVYTSLQGQTSAVAGLAAPLEWNLGFFHILNSAYVVRANAFVGLSDGSPAFGVSAGFVRWF